MKRKLLRQMANQWQSNIWLIVELVIVSIVVWYCAWFFLAYGSMRYSDKGYDLSDDIYVAKVNKLSAESDDYSQWSDSTHTFMDDLGNIRKNLLDNPYILMVGTGMNALPYNYNYMGANIALKENDSILTLRGNLRSMSPSVVEIIGLRGLRGETPEELAEALRRGELLVGDNDISFFENEARDPFLFSGREVMCSDDSATVMRTGPAVNSIQRSDYEPTFSPSIILPLDEAGELGGYGVDNNSVDEVIMKVRPGEGIRFLEMLTPEMCKSGNIFISDFKSISQMRDLAHLQDTIVIRDMAVVGGFLLMVVFLGFLGTFWLRTRERESEIAIRRVNGATARDIFTRMLGEGFILLVAATVIAVAVELLLCHYQVVNCDLLPGSYGRYQAMIVTFIVLAMMIVAGIWMPATRAMKLQPSQILKDQ